MARPRKVEENRRIIELKDKAGLSFAEIAKIYGTTKSNIHERYYRHKGLI